MEGIAHYALTGASVAGFLLVIAGPFLTLAYRHLHACLHRIEARLDKHLPLMYSQLRDTEKRLIAQETLERERNR